MKYWLEIKGGEFGDIKSKEKNRREGQEKKYEEFLGNNDIEIIQFQKLNSRRQLA